ncbi:hypothetical protein GKC29_27665 [Micromonospora sp. WMMC415]|uniref:hypothetical protein n=1 Tax=Micromonospora sp. WMMC415 TaxID=2675222 RepID=UPI0012B4EC1C|nr:hypothetical protein [Micromonospora sp. WMMC415]QGN50224.1 hypothetical protein GKC29_27665 [Micromonospora sp. WMMC415]
MIPEKLWRFMYPVKGTDCVVWLGAHDKRHGACYYHVAGGQDLNVRKELFGDPVPHGFSFVEPTCGNRRCVSVQHTAIWEYTKREPRQ